MSRADLRTTLCGVPLSNPLILAAGILGTTAPLLERVARAGAGAVTTKSLGPQPRAGHPNPTVLDWGPGLINAIGLANPGAEEGKRIVAQAKERLAPLGVPLMASIFAPTVEEFAEVARTISEAQPDLIEVNISCPNVAHEWGLPFALDAGTAAAVTQAVKAATTIPMAVKLSPNVTDIVAIARAVAEAGADAITAINTVGPGMIIDLECGRPILAHKVGGVSGPAIRPLAVRCIYEIAGAVDIPIIGTGGVSSGRDVVEMLMAGATAVGVGSAVYQGGPEVFGQMAAELAQFMTAHGYSCLEEIRGLAHRVP